MFSYVRFPNFFYVRFYSITKFNQIQRMASYCKMFKTLESVYNISRRGGVYDDFEGGHYFFLLGLRVAIENSFVHGKRFKGGA